jgi:hypothetical protein
MLGTPSRTLGDVFAEWMRNNGRTEDELRVELGASPDQLEQLSDEIVYPGTIVEVAGRPAYGPSPSPRDIREIADRNQIDPAALTRVIKSL